MANEKQAVGSSFASINQAERIKKASATRAVTAAKVAKLSGENHYIYTRLSLLRSSCERMQAHILGGGNATGELAEACGELDKKIGQAMFA